MPSPSRLIAISAPSWNIPIPTTSINAPNRNVIIFPALIGTIETVRKNTSTVIGITAANDSIMLDLSFGFKSVTPKHVLLEILYHTAG